MIFQPSKKKFEAAIANAVEYGKIPADKDYKLVMCGTGGTTQHFLYWVHFNKIAEVRHDSLGKAFFVGHAERIEQGSPLSSWLTEWVR